MSIYSEIRLFKPQSISDNPLRWFATRLAIYLSTPIIIGAIVFIFEHDVENILFAFAFCYIGFRLDKMRREMLLLDLKASVKFHVMTAYLITSLLLLLTTLSGFNLVNEVDYTLLILSFLFGWYFHLITEAIIKLVRRERDDVLPQENGSVNEHKPKY